MEMTKAIAKPGRQHKRQGEASLELRKFDEKQKDNTGEYLHRLKGGVLVEEDNALGREQLTELITTRCGKQLGEDTGKVRRAQRRGHATSPSQTSEKENGQLCENEPSTFPLSTERRTDLTVPFGMWTQAYGERNAWSETDDR